MIGEHLTTAFTHIRRSPYQAFAAVLVMSLMFFTASIISYLGWAAGSTLRYFETRPQVIVFLKNEATPEEISALQRKLIESHQISGELKFVSHEEAFRIFQNAVDNPLITQLLPSDVFQASLEFSLANLSSAQEVINGLKSEAIVDQVEFTGSIGGESSISTVINNLERITRYIRIGGATLISYLVLTAIFILIVIIGMRTASRREEIEILKLIGATNAFIRAPFLLEGIIYGVIGALVGFLISLILLLYTMPFLARYFGEIPVVPQSLNTLALYLGMLLGGELVFALVIGVVGSWIALSRYLRL